MGVWTDRLRADLRENASFGAIEEVEGGRTVLAGTEANGRARGRLVDRLQA
jgi:hypothetical protein